MNNMNPIRRFALVSGLLATQIVAGCSTTPIAHGEKFTENDAVTATGRMAQAQAAAGAKEDAMLYDRNFHGTELNSLGQGKLDLMVKGTPVGDPVYVYMDMPHDQVASRQAAVTAYLKAAGVHDDKIIVADGINPNTTTPTAYNIGGLYKGDPASFNGASVTDSSAAPASGGGGGGGASH